MRLPHFPGLGRARSGESASTTDQEVDEIASADDQVEEEQTATPQGPSRQEARRLAERERQEAMRRHKEQESRANEISERAANPEGKLAALDALIDFYANISEEDMDVDNPFRESTSEEKRKQRIHSALRKVGIGLLFAGGTVAVGWAAIPVALTGMAVGLATSSAAGGGVDLFRGKAKIIQEEGGKVSVEEHEKNLKKKLFDREKTIRLALKASALEVIAVRHDSNLSENLRQMAINQAKQNFIDKYLELRDKESEENQEAQKFLEEYTKSRKKWAWIKAGVSIVAGVTAGSALTHALQGVVREGLQKAGVAMGEHGMGRAAEVLGLESTGHNVHLATGVDGQQHLVFDYSPEEMAKIASDEGRKALADAGLSLGQDSVGGAAVNADFLAHGMHVMADGSNPEMAQLLMTQFGERISGEISRQAVANYAAVAGGVVTGEAAAETSAYLTARNMDQASRLYKPLDKVIGQNGEEFKNSLEGISQSAQIREINQFFGNSPETPFSNQKFISKQDITIGTQENPRQYTFPAGTTFIIAGVDPNGFLQMRPIDQSGRIMPGFVVPFSQDRQVFIEQFEVPEQLIDIDRRTMPPQIGSLVKNIHDDTYGQVVMIYPASGEVAVGPRDNPQDQPRWDTTSYDFFVNNYKYLADNRPPIYSTPQPAAPAPRVTQPSVTVRPEPARQVIAPEAPVTDDQIRQHCREMLSHLENQAITERNQGLHSEEIATRAKISEYQAIIDGGGISDQLRDEIESDFRRINSAALESEDGYVHDSDVVPASSAIPGIPSSAAKPPAPGEEGDVDIEFFNDDIDIELFSDLTEEQRQAFEGLKGTNARVEVLRAQSRPESPLHSNYEVQIAGRSQLAGLTIGMSVTPKQELAPGEYYGVTVSQTFRTSAGRPVILARMNNPVVAPGSPRPETPPRLALAPEERRAIEASVGSIETMPRAGLIEPPGRMPGEYRVSSGGVNIVIRFRDGDLPEELSMEDQVRFKVTATHLDESEPYVEAEVVTDDLKINKKLSQELGKVANYIRGVGSDAEAERLRNPGFVESWRKTCVQIMRYNRTSLRPGELNTHLLESGAKLRVFRTTNGDTEINLYSLNGAVVHARLLGHQEPKHALNYEVSLTYTQEGEQRYLDLADVGEKISSREREMPLPIQLAPDGSEEDGGGAEGRSGVLPVPPPPPPVRPGGSRPPESGEGRDERSGLERAFGEPGDGSGLPQPPSLSSSTSPSSEGKAMGDGAAEPPAPEAGGQPELTPELQAEAQKIAEALAKLPSDADGFEQIRGDRGTISRFREFAQTVIQDILPRLQVDKDGLKVFKDVISANCTITLSSRIDSSVELFFNPKTGIIHFLVADFDSSGVEKSIYYGYWDGENDHNHDLLHQPSEAAPGPTTGSGDGLLPPFEDVEGESATTPDKGKEGEHRIVWSPLIDERPLDGSVKQLKSEADKAVSGDEEAIKWLVDRTDTRDSANLVRRLCKEDQVDQLRKYAKLPFRISFLPHYAQAALRLMDENATIEERLFATFLSLGLDPRSLMEATGGREELPGWEYWSTQSAFAYSPKKVLERMVGASGVVGTFYLLNRPLILPLLADVIRDEKFSTEEKVSALTIITSGQTQEPEEACINGLSQELYTILDSSQDQRLKLRAAVALTLSDEPEEKVITTIRQANLNRDMLGYYSEILNSPAGDQEVFERRVRIIDAIAGEYRTMREGFLAEENAEQLEIDSNPKLKAVAIPVFEALNNMPEADDGFEQIRENTEIKSMLENVGRVVCDDLFPDPLPERNKGLRYTDPSGGVLFIRPVSYRNLVEVRFRLSRPGASHQVHANIESGTGRPLSLEYRYSSNDKVSIRDLLSLPTEGEEAPAAPQEGDSAQTSPAVPPEPPVEAAGEAAETTAGQSTETGDGSVRGAETQKEHLAVKDTGGEDVELKPGTKFEMVGDESDSVYEIAKAVQTDDGDWAITFMDDEGKQDEPDIRPATEWQEIFAEMFKRRGNV